MKLRTLFAALLVATPLPALAHKAFLVPSATVLPPQSWITVDAAVSNDLFYFNHNPMRTESLAVTAPDGSAVAPQGASTGKYRSTFDVELAKDGTYRIAVASAGLFASWEENGEPKRWRGTPETFAAEVPKDAAKLQVTQNAMRVETFATAGTPTPLKTTGQGLELAPVTHPNDLFAGEAATFALLIDGRPAANVDVTVIPGGTRYRDAQDEIKATTGADGKFSVTWPAPGLYWLNAQITDDKNLTPPATQRRASYTATLEVLPQ
jgi:uncharacterized GH25 family protein